MEGANRSRSAPPVCLDTAIRPVLQHACLPAAATSGKAATPKHHGDVLREIYRKEIGVVESGGSNDGRRVEEYLGYCGLGKGYPWCAAFVSWCHGQAGYPEPRNAWAAALFPVHRRVSDPRQGDVFGIYYSNLRRIAHCGFVDGWDSKHCITVEGNTGPDGIIDENGGPANPIRAGPSREGVYSKRRPIRTIHAVARWTE